MGVWQKQRRGAVVTRMLTSEEDMINLLNGQVVDLHALSDFKQTELFEYKQSVLSFFERLSASYLKDSQYRKYPDIIALGFWLRRQNLENILDSQLLHPNTFRSPRGVVFHVAPANVDTIFVYSLAISMLAGNSNVVRVSSRNSSIKDILISSFKRILEQSGNTLVSERLLLLNYGHDADVSMAISKMCDVRMLWGGDESITYFSQMETQAHCLDIKFSNKNSIAVIDCHAFDDMSEEQKVSLCQKFVRDSFSFGQQACSSPQGVVWLNSSKNVSVGINAREVFWEKVSSELLGFDTNFDASDFVTKYVYELEVLAKGNGILDAYSPECHVMQATCEDTLVRKNHCGRGLFYQCEVAGLDSLNQHLHRGVQTITYFGISHTSIKDWLARGLAGVDRIVPIGTALDFDVIWDGVNLIEACSRLTYIK